MTKPSLPRPIEEIQREFNQLTLKAGQIQHQIYLTGRDLEQVNDQLRDLAFEYLAAKKTAETPKESSDEKNA